MYKIIAILIVFVATFFLCTGFTPIKQIVIPLSEKDGIPYVCLDIDDIYIDGFAVDSNENFYFSGGGKEAYLYCFNSMSSKEIYRSKLPNITSGSLHIENDILYMVSQWNPGKNLCISQINIDSGKIVSTNNKTLPFNLNRAIFTDNHISLWYLEREYKQGKVVDLLDKYSQFDFCGNKIKDINNIYNISAAILSDKDHIATSQYIGRFQNKHVFYNIEVNDYCTFYLVDNTGAILKKRDIPFKEIGSLLNAASMGNPEEHKVIRNGNIYILGYKNNNLIITVYSLDNFFTIN